MKHLLTALLMASATSLGAVGVAGADDGHVAPVTAYLTENVAPWVNDPVIIAAIKAQNEANAHLTQADIDTLDKKWRAEVDSADHSMIDGVLGNAASKFLQEKQGMSDGTITEVFVMDNKGLNVAQSDLTSDYWQGDEAKFQKSFGVGKDAVFVDDVEKDESTQALQSQASMTISDESGTPIGAITVGISLDKL